jgi:hypothetical protein
MEQRNLHSTKLHAPLPLSMSLNVNPSEEPQNKATHNLFALLLPTSDLCKSYSNQTGRFPIQLSRGYQYVFILYEYDSNAILFKPLKTRQAMDITTAWTKLHHKLQANGFPPTLHILDKECSQVMKQAFAKHLVKFQLMPPHVHCRNAAKRHPDLEEPLQRRDGHMRPKIPSCRVGPAHATSGSHIQPSTIFTALSKTIGPLLPQQALQFFEDSSGTTRHPSCCPYHSITARRHGSSWSQWLVHGSIPRPLLMPPVLHPIHFPKLERPHCQLVPTYCPIPKS